MTFQTKLRGSGFFENYDSFNSSSKVIFAVYFLKSHISKNLII